MAMLLYIFGTMIAFLAVTYVAGLMMVVIYECRMQQVYRAKKRALDDIHASSISAAVAYAKTFKIDQDYRKLSAMLDRRQREILKRMPYFRRAYL
jgi:hypothetical protein